MAEWTGTLPSGDYSFGLPDLFDGNAGWLINSGRPQITGGLVPSGTTRYVRGFWITRSDATITLHIEAAASGAVQSIAELSDAFETDGTITIQAAGQSLTVSLNSADLTEPYVFVASNSAEVQAFYDALSTDDDSTEGTITLRDFVPAAPAFADDTGDAFTGTVGTAIADITVPEATGNPTPTYAAVGTLPAGLQFDTGTRVISGTPEAGAVGSGTITIRATNSQGSDDWTVDYTFTIPLAEGNANPANWLFNVPDATGLTDVAPAFADDTGDEITAIVGEAITAATIPRVSAGHPAPTYELLGEAPAGLNVVLPTADSDGSITGTPSVEGLGRIRVRASNSQGSAEWSVGIAFGALGMSIGITPSATSVDAGDSITLTAEAYGDLISISQGGAESEHLWALIPFNDGTWRLFQHGSIAGANLRNPRGLGTRGGNLYAVDWWGEDIWRITGLDTSTAIEIGTESSGAFGSPEGAAFLGDVFWAIDQNGDDLWSWADVDNAPNGGQQRGNVTITGDPRGMTVRNDLLVIVTVSGTSWSFLQIDNPATGASTTLATVTRPTGITGDPRAIQEYRGGLLVLTDDAELVELTGIGDTPALVERADFDETGMGSHGPGGMTQFPMPASYAWTSDNGGTFGDAAALSTTWEADGVAPGTDVVLTQTVTDQGGNTLARTVTVRVTAPELSGDASPANWLFNVPDATGETTPPAFSGDAEAANWEFDVPDAGAQHTPPGTDGIAVAVSWAFDVPMAAGETTPPNFAGNADAVRFAFEVPTAAGVSPPFAGNATPVSFAFRVPDATGESPPFAGNAGPIRLLFDVPDATGSTVPPAFAGDGSAANWLINVPVATGFTVAPGTADNGDAQPASWAFMVPDAAGETVPPNLEGSALAASWAFQVPNAAGLTVPPGAIGVADPANWLFNVPPAAGTTTPPGTSGIADPANWEFNVPQAAGLTVPPGNNGVALAANWLFDVPDATGSATIPDRSGDALAASWAFQVPNPTGRTAAPQDGSAEAAAWAFEVPATAVGASGMLDDNGDGSDVAWAFRVPAAEGSAVNPIIATQSSPPLFPRLEGGGGMHLDLLWEPPLNDGGGTIARYEAFLCDEVGQNCGWETVWTGGERRHRFRGLRSLGSYRVRMRAINEAGPSDESEEVEAFPYTMPATVTPPPGAAIPLIDADRQSLIVRLDNRDCRITVWWQPSDASWYAQLEVPTNTVVVTGRRLALNAGILDRLEGDAILPGNIVCREIGESGLDPARDAWRSGNYQLRWEPLR